MNDPSSTKNGGGPGVAALVERHLGLAQAIGRSYQKTLPSVDYGDLAAEAMLGLAKAAEAFDEKLQVPFAAYANRVIRNQLNSLYRVEIEYRTNEKVVLDAPKLTEGDDDSQKDRVPEISVNPDRQAHRNEVTEILSQEVEALTERQKEILQSISRGESFVEIAQRLAISKQAAHKAGKRALEQIKTRIEARGINGILFQSGVEKISEPDKQGEEPSA